MKRNIKAVIFDLDGTLACTAGDLLNGINHMLHTAFGFPPISMEEMMTAVNFCEREYVKRLCELAIGKSGREDIVLDEETVDKCVALYTNHYGAHYLDTTYVYEGVAEAVDRIKAAGLPLAVCTNKLAKQAEEIVDLLFPGRFDILVGDGMYTHKPDPEGALAIAKEFGVSPAECLFIGDSDVDMQTAKNAGMIAVGVSWGYRDEGTLRQAGADEYVTDGAGILSLCL